MVQQLLWTAPRIRKELIKQIMKVRRAPDEVLSWSQYKVTVEDASDDDKLIKPKTLSKNVMDRVLEEKEIDVAMLPSARSTTVRTKDRKTVITIGDPVLQYLSSLSKRETSSKTFYMKKKFISNRA
jgi:KaiC/GvpD/RAD55 family RecA-like ATPase